MSGRQFDTRMLARWTASFVGFPLAGLAAKAAAGPIDTGVAAAVGGLAAGAVLGLAQSLALRATAMRRLRWMVATAIGMSAGLTIGSGIVDHATDVASLVVMGAVTGAGIGVAQTMVMDGPVWRRVVWLVLTPALWALGWLITSQVIKDIDARYANFGASGALLCAAVGGVVMAIGPSRERSTNVAAAASRVDAVL